MKKFIIAVLIFCFGLYFCNYRGNIVQAEDKKPNLENLIENLIDWKKSDVGSDSGFLLNNEMLSLAGTTAGDWYPIGIGRYNYKDNYTGYLAVIIENINKRYNEKGKLNAAKATEWHRISLAVTAAGGNPESIGEYNGAPINLIADGTYNRGLTASPGRQGINGWIWALIALDSKRYEVPADAFNTRQDLIIEIMKSELGGGGFSLSGNVADPDITAMAVQALSPYYNSEIEFKYSSSKIKDENGEYIKVSKTVRQCVDKCLDVLSKTQQSDGDYSSWGTQNVESACQVLTALNCLGIDALHDERFIKNGNTLLDGILKYRLASGGFVHSLTYDASNPSSKPDEANSMAGEQVLYTLVSLWRYENGMRTLYDMRKEFSPSEKTLIAEAVGSIKNLSDNSTAAEVTEVLNLYKAVDPSDRCYVYNYYKLSDEVIKRGLSDLFPSEEVNFSGNGGESEEIIYEFSDTEKQQTESLPDIADIDTSYFTEVLNLKYILKNCGDFENKNRFVIKIDKYYNQIIAVQNEIDSINTEIKDKLYPFDKIGIGDRSEINSILLRYNKLSDYDKTKINGYEDLIKSKTQADNLFVALILGIICCIIITVLSLIIFLNIKKRKKMKADKIMPESEE